MYPFSKGVAASWLVLLHLVVLRMGHHSCSAQVSGYFCCTGSCLVGLNVSDQKLIFCKDLHNWHFGFAHQISCPADWRPQGPWAEQVDAGCLFQFQSMSPSAGKSPPAGELDCPLCRVIFPVAKQPLTEGQLLSLEQTLPWWGRQQERSLSCGRGNHRVTIIIWFVWWMP